jgi:hypothetical protein
MADAGSLRGRDETARLLAVTLRGSGTVDDDLDPGDGRVDAHAGRQVGRREAHAGIGDDAPGMLAPAQHADRATVGAEPLDDERSEPAGAARDKDPRDVDLARVDVHYSLLVTSRAEWGSTS